MAQTFTAAGNSNSTSAGGYALSLRPRIAAGQEGPKLALLDQEAEANQTSAVGLAMDRDDGNVYRYSHFVSAVGPGKLASLDISVAGFASIDGKFTDSAGTAKDDYGTTDDTIYLTDTATFQSENDAANVWAGGQLFITDAAGEGMSYRIKEHPQPEVEPATAGAIKLVLVDTLRVALDSETSCAIFGHPYKNLAIANNGTDDHVQGATVRDMTAAYCGWLCTWGYTNVLYDVSAGTAAAGTVAVLSDGVNGAIAPLGQGTVIASETLITSDFDFGQVTTEPIIGTMGEDTTDTEYGPVHVELNP